MKYELNSAVKVKSPKEIMVGFLAASVVERDCWKEEVAWVCEEARLYNNLTSEEYKALKAPMEKEFKEKNDLKQMPGKYRSTKSVIVNALKNNVELLDNLGFPKGKSEVELDIKIVSVTNKVITKSINEIENHDPKSVQETDLYNSCYYAAAYIKNHINSLSGPELDVILKTLEEIFKNGTK